MKGYIFDFGGTLDTNGCHWGKFIWHAYERQHVPVNWEQFREAYIFAEQQLGKNAIILPTDSFRQTLDKKLRIEMERLVTQGYWYSSPLEVERLHAAVLDDLYSRVCEHVTCGREVLLRLKPHYPLVLCSNFYGNLTEVLKDFQLDGLFQDVVESAVVGIRKPDVRIYELALRSLGGVEAAADVVVVGEETYDLSRVVQKKVMGKNTQKEEQKPVKKPLDDDEDYDPSEREITFRAPAVERSESSVNMPHS